MTELSEEERSELGKKLIKDLEKDQASKLKKAQDQDLKKEIDGKDWNFSYFVWAIAILVPSWFWVWPKIPKSWYPDSNMIIIASGIFVAIAGWIKFRKILKDLESEATNPHVTSSKPVSSERESINLKVDFDCKEYACKPLTKSYSKADSSKFAKKAMYRHEGKIKNDNLDELLGPKITKWGGSESSSSASSGGRSIQKKAPNR